MMSGYKRVNYYELCRLCTCTEGKKIHIFKEEGRRRQLPTKIERCLPLKVFDGDSLPKMICTNCVTKLEEIDSFQQLCVEAEKMLQDFRATFKNTIGDNDGMLQVYVKASQSQIIETKNLPSNESVTRSNDVQRVSGSESEAEQRIVNYTDACREVPEESGQLPLRCTNPLKLNGATASLVPLNVENMSSLMQVVPDDELPHIQQFKLPMQAEMAVVNERNARFSVILPAVNAVAKENPNVIQSLKCAVNDDGSIDMHKIDLQSTIATSCVSFNNSVAVSLMTSSPASIVPNDEVQEIVSQVNVTKEELIMKSCTHCGRVLSGPKDVCNHTVVRPMNSPVSAGCETTSTTVIQTDSPKLPSGKLKRLFPELNEFSCDICEKPFRKKEHLLQHRKLHSGDRPFVCGSCGKSFSRKEHLFRHMLAHTGEKRHSCDFCGKTFSRKDNLHKHRKIHGFNGPYECELCGKSFIVQHYYLMHKANHSNADTEDLPFQCDICKKGFQKEEFLNRHRVRHRARNSMQLVEPDLSTLNPVALLSPSNAQQNLCIEDTVYVSTQPTTYSISTSVASNTTTSTQTPFSADLTINGQLLESFRQFNSSIISS